MGDKRHDGVGASLRRLRLIAGHTLGEALRLRLTTLLGVVAGLLLLGSHWLRDFNFGAAEVAFIGDLGLGVIGLTGTVLAALVAAHLFFDDLAGAAACVLTRPVRRWEFVVGQFAGVAGLLALYTAVLGGLLGMVLLWRAQQLGAAVVGLPAFFSACALQWMKFTLVAAMTHCVCAYAGSALFASCAGLMLAVIGHLRPFASGTMMEWLRIWPNLALFNAAGLLSAGQPTAGPEMIQLGIYWATCLFVAGLMSSYVFKHREF